MKVFIVGAAGRTGFRLAALLRKHGDHVDGLVRKPGQVDRLAEAGVTPILGDIASIDQETLSAMIEGFDVVVFCAGASESDSDAMMDVIDGDGVTLTIAAAKHAGVRRIYLVSAFPEASRGGPVDESFEHYIEVKKRSEVTLAASELDWVILRPSVLLDSPGEGKVALSFAQFHTEISRDDVAATLVALIHAPAVKRVILELTHGATPIPEAVRWIAEQVATA